MADKAHIQTDRILEEMERRLSAIYYEAEKDIEKKAKDYFDKFIKIDEQKKKLVKSGKLSQEEYIKWRRNKIMYGKHWGKLKEQLAKEYANVNRTALSYINDQIPDVYAINYNGMGEGFDDKVNGYSFELVDAQTVKNLASTNDTLLPYKYLNGIKDMRWNTQKINAAILQGILQGESISKIARRLRGVTEMNRVSSIRNARTMITSAECKGRQDSFIQAEKDGIKLQREWIATFDTRTRHSHALLDGQLADVDKPFKSIFGDIMYPGDPNANPSNVYNCRCTIAAKVIGFGNRKNGFSAEDSSSDIGKAEQIGTVDFSDEKKILNILSDAEKETVDLPYEVNHTITSDGKVWRVKGDKASVNPNSIPSSLIGSYSYHNHPEKETWYSFSAEDVGMFMENKQKYSKASDNVYEYVMQRAKDTVDMDYDTAYNIFKDIEKKEILKMKWEQTIDADVDGYHSVMDILSKRYKFKYERKKRNDK